MRQFLGMRPPTSVDNDASSEDASLATLEEHLWRSIKATEESKQRIDDMQRLSAIRDARFLLWIFPALGDGILSLTTAVSGWKFVSTLLNAAQGKPGDGVAFSSRLAGWLGLGLSSYIFQRWFHTLPLDNLFRRSVAVAHLTTLFLGSFKLGRLYVKNLAADDQALVWSHLNQRLGIVMYTEMARLGGMWVKSGQFMGARSDVVPKEFVNELSKLQDSIPARPFSDVRTTIEEALQSPIDAVFDRFDEQPLAAASIAQV
jgi:hypothetical protein